MPRVCPHSVKIPVSRCTVSGLRCEVVIEGLLGGHSGAEIDKNRANANLLLGRFLYGLEQKMNFGLMEAEGGLKDNAIPRTSRAVLVVDEADAQTLAEHAAKLEAELKKNTKAQTRGITIAVTMQDPENLRCFHR